MGGLHLRLRCRLWSAANSVAEETRRRWGSSKRGRWWIFMKSICGVVLSMVVIRRWRPGSILTLPLFLWCNSRCLCLNGERRKNNKKAMIKRQWIKKSWLEWKARKEGGGTNQHQPGGKLLPLLSVSAKLCVCIICLCLQQQQHQKSVHCQWSGGPVDSGSGTVSHEMSWWLHALTEQHLPAVVALTGARASASLSKQLRCRHMQTKEENCRTELADCKFFLLFVFFLSAAAEMRVMLISQRR